MFQVGAIRKVEVSNFVTYTHIEYFPGPNLNMLIGPNGTGKSTIVAAIILGLGGSPKTVGRGKRISEYVKHNCTEAKVHVFLHIGREDKFLKITRKFNIQNHNIWELDNQRVPYEDVMERVKVYKIQVDNLCQFLPQDRVQDFAKLNQQELLKETQSALCRHDLIEKQTQLVQHRADQKKLGETVEKSQAKLEEYRDANARLEGKVTNWNKQKEYMEQIQRIDRKLAWIGYEDLAEKTHETKGDVNKAAQIYEKHKARAKPVERKVQEAKKEATGLQLKSSKVARLIKEAESTIKTNLDNINKMKLSIDRFKSDMAASIAEIEQREKDIETTSLKVAEYEAMQKQQLEEYGNDEEVQKKISRLTKEMTKFKDLITTIRYKKEEIEVAKQDCSGQLRMHQNELERIQNIKQKRLDHLRQVNPDAYKAVLWLRENKQMFKGEIYEPMMLEINVLDPKNAIYLENVISNNDSVAFTCVEVEDVNAFLKKLRGDLKLSVNIVHSGNNAQSSASFQPSVPIEQLKRYGLYTYCHSLFKAPEPIMSYLLKNYQLHNIPVGTAATNECFDQVPQPIRIFFSDKQRFSVRFSKYTGLRSTAQSEIYPHNSFSIAVDMVRLENLQGQMTQIKSEVENFNSQLSKYTDQTTQLNENMGKLSDQLKHIYSVKQRIQSISGRVEAMKKRIAEMRRSGASSEDIRKQCMEKSKRVIVQMARLHIKNKEDYKKLSSLNLQNSKLSLNSEFLKNKVNVLENKVEDLRRLCKEAEETLNTVKEAYSRIKSQAKQALQKAKTLSKGFTPDDKGFDEFRAEYEKLASDVEILQGERKKISSLIDCLNTADADELREYEERLKEIENLQVSIDRAHIELNKLNAKIERVLEEWLVPLKELLSEINLKFGLAFERIGCIGEISLNTGEDEREFINYGLRIKVAYRNGEPLQELNSTVQSGGERAVATAAFMLSLQELTPVPFRCVDEINQGMDASNERKILELLVELTDKPETPQYFLITPKLVHNFPYSRSMMVHTVHNGPFIEADRKWSYTKMCNPQGVQIR